MRLRLIDVETYQFVDPAKLWAEEKVEYGILSHRWLADADEVKFHEVGLPELARRKNGFFKIAWTCELAKGDGLRYVWLDTCCIDKSSSAELQESINSMFRWYAESSVCYVYLKDIDLRSYSSPEAIKNDEWFDRGWTLQELIAPKRVEFYDRNWGWLGSKYDLKQQIHEKTGISLALLENQAELQDFSIAERMSWAASRKTTVLEDRTYSLFGLFNVNLPMLYGERENAFQRLQEEIIKTSDDHSIFAWKGVGQYRSGLLATAPEDFATCGSVKSTRLRKGRSAYRVTNRGVEITLNLTPWTLDTYFARIHCNDLAANASDPAAGGPMAGIFLQRLEEDDQYARIEVEGQEVVNNVRQPLNWQDNRWDNLAREVPVYVRRTRGPQLDFTGARMYGYRIHGELLERTSKGEPLFTFQGPKGFLFDDYTRTVTIPNGSGSMGLIANMDISQQGKEICEIKLCFDFGFNPVLFLATSGAIGQKVKIFNKDGLFNIGSDWQFSAEEVHDAKPLSERTPHDQLGWSVIYARGDRSVASESGNRSGLWALKADRIDGLDVTLAGTDIRVVLKKIETDHGLIWDLRIENMTAKALRKLFR